MYDEMFRMFQPTYDPRHIQAYVLLEVQSLSGASEEKLRHEAQIAAACIDADGIQVAESLAKSFGL